MTPYDLQVVIDVVFIDCGVSKERGSRANVRIDLGIDSLQ
jgi:hypothetical protein